MYQNSSSNRIKNSKRMRIKFQNYKGACLLLMTIVSSISIFADTPNWQDAQWIWQQ
jgi:hypothetical protein